MNVVSKLLLRKPYPVVFMQEIVLHDVIGAYLKQEITPEIKHSPSFLFVLNHLI